MNVLKALDKALTAFVNELWPQPPAQFDGEWLAEREAAEDVSEPQFFPAFGVDPDREAGTAGGCEPAQDTTPGTPPFTFDELHDAAVLLWRYSATDVQRHDSDQAFTLSRKFHQVADAMKLNDPA